MTGRKSNVFYMVERSFGLSTQQLNALYVAEATLVCIYTSALPLHLVGIFFNGNESCNTTRMHDLR